jgi:hypothetical protein
MFHYLVGAFFGFVITVFSMLVYLAFGDGSVSPVSKDHYIILKDFVSPVISGFAGAIAGAMCAYAFTVIKQARSDLEQAAEVYVSLMYTASAMLQDVSVTIDKIIKPHEDSPVRFLTIPHLGYNIRSYEQNLDKRVFGLFVKLRAVDANSKLSLAISMHENLVHQISSRRELMNEYTLKKNHGLGGFARNSTLHEIAEIVGLDVAFNVYEASEGLIETLGRCEESLVDFIKYLALKGEAYFEGKGVSIFIPVLKAGRKKIKKPTIESLDKLKSILQLSPLRGISLSASDWTIPLTGRQCYY